MGRELDDRAWFELETGLDRVRLALHALGFLIGTGDHAEIHRDQLSSLVFCVEEEANRLYGAIFAR